MSFKLPGVMLKLLPLKLAHVYFSVLLLLILLLLILKAFNITSITVEIHFCSSCLLSKILFLS